MPDPVCRACGAIARGRFCGTCGAAVAPVDPAREGAGQAPGGPDEAGGPASEATTGRVDWRPLPPLRPAPPPGDSHPAADAWAGSGGASPPAPDVSTPGPDTGGVPFVVGATYPDGVEAPRRSYVPVVAALVVALLALAGGVWWVAGRDRDGAPHPQQAAPTVMITGGPASPSASVSSPSAFPSTTAPVTPPPGSTVTVTASAPVVTVTPLPPPASAPQTPWPDDDGEPTSADNAAAEAQLAAQRQSDAAGFDRSPHVFVQLSSKHDGTVDPAQPTARGTTRWTSVDILEQYRALRSSYGQVRLLRGTDVGSTNRFRNDWVMIYDPMTFASKPQAQKWCDANVPGGKNACYAAETK